MLNGVSSFLYLLSPPPLSSTQLSSILQRLCVCMCVCASFSPRLHATALTRAREAAVLLPLLTNCPGTMVQGKYLYTSTTKIETKFLLRFNSI